MLSLAYFPHMTTMAIERPELFDAEYWQMKETCKVIKEDAELLQREMETAYLSFTNTGTCDHAAWLDDFPKKFNELEDRSYSATHFRPNASELSTFVQTGWPVKVPMSITVLDRCSDKFYWLRLRVSHWVSKVLGCPRCPDITDHDRGQPEFHKLLITNGVLMELITVKIMLKGLYRRFEKELEDGELLERFRIAERSLFEDEESVETNETESSRSD